MLSLVISYQCISCDCNHHRALLLRLFHELPSSVFFFFPVCSLLVTIFQIFKGISFPVKACLVCLDLRVWIQLMKWKKRWESLSLFRAKTLRQCTPNLVSWERESVCVCVRWESWWFRSFSRGAGADKCVAARHYLCHHVSLSPPLLLSLFLPLLAPLSVSFICCLSLYL